MLHGQIIEIITSRAYISFGGFITFEKDDAEYKMLKKVFVYLSNKHQVYCNHVVIKVQFYNDTYYIGYNDSHICIKIISFSSRRQARKEFRKRLGK